MRKQSKTNGRKNEKFGNNANVGKENNIEKLTCKSQEDIENENVYFDNYHKILELDYRFWIHYSEYLHNQQMSSFKNYLWLAVTILTGCFGLYSTFVNVSSPSVDKLFYSRILLFLSVLFSLVASVCGVTGLSSLYFKNKPADPFVGGKEYLNRLDYFFMCNKEEFMKMYAIDLKLLDSYFCDCIEESRKLINAKGKLLRCINILIIISGSFFTVALVFFILNKVV